MLLNFLFYLSSLKAKGKKLWKKVREFTARSKKLA